MSADLFEAFVGTQKSRIDPKEPVTRHSSGLLIQPGSASKTEDTWQSWPTAVQTTSESTSKHQSHILWETDDNGSNVLFDAGEFDADPAPSTSEDDFGNFEQAMTQKQDNRVSHVASEHSTANLLDLDTDENFPKGFTETKQSPKAAEPSSRGVPPGQFSQTVRKEEVTASADDQDDEWGDFESIEERAPVAERLRQREPQQNMTASTIRKKPNPIVAKSREETTSNPLDLKPNFVENEQFEEEPWANFDHDEPDNSNTSNNLAKSSLRQDPFEPVGPADVVQRARPINVPPPAVLLAWLPNVFSELATQARQSSADVAVGIAAVQAYRLSARVIAGRAGRWKRDTILAQSMKIGAAGRSGGMKLTALDKGESRKEDQAAEEVIVAWTRSSHVLNAAIIRAKAQKPPMALSSKLSARITTGLDVVTATHICAVCGLRRNERVIGIDVSVFDTFGEFWVEHWGHKDCADIWYGFNKLLDQR